MQLVILSHNGAVLELSCSCKEGNSFLLLLEEEDIGNIMPVFAGEEPETPWFCPLLEPLAIATLTRPFPQLGLATDVVGNTYEELENSNILLPDKMVLLLLIKD